MANTLLTPDKIAKAALATLYENTVAAQLVHRDYDGEFVGAVGDTITVRKPAVFEAQEFDPNTGINIQNATETGVPVVLNHHKDVSFAVTARQLTLEVEDFAVQFLNPALEAIAQGIDRDILAFRDDITQSVGTVSGELWSDPESLIAAGVLLDIANVPAADRRVIAGPRTRGKWLANDLLKRADRSGSTAALREGSIGSDVFGFGAYMSQNIGQPPAIPEDGDPTTEVNVAFHRTAVALATRQLELPRGASDATIMGYKGFGIRVVFDYDISLKKDVVSLDVLYGVKTLDAARAVLIKGADYDDES